MFPFGLFHLQPQSSIKNPVSWAWMSCFSKLGRYEWSCTKIAFKGVKMCQILPWSACCSASCRFCIRDFVLCSAAVNRSLDYCGASRSALDLLCKYIRSIQTLCATASLKPSCCWYFSRFDKSRSAVWQGVLVLLTKVREELASIPFQAVVGSHTKNRNHLPSSVLSFHFLCSWFALSKIPALCYQRPG